ncbi:hypothetical protein P3X46_009865 [Hevea brasiliensis]|uniref:Poly [ADP-ribose] polymerase n=1 Tax=Hevea brasiliensis TaxID=3981 RepID=A0ABQ9MGA9_HEVBR|nr:hypothetical protein P3X46_009865 [Hevea brasiliensis]
MKVHETKSQAHAPAADEGKVMTRKQKAENKGHDGEQSPKKAKTENESDRANGKTRADIAREFEDFCKSIREHLSVAQMREILELNDQDSSGSDGSVTTKCQDLLFLGALGKCPLCDCNLEFDGKRYSCKGFYSEWSSCTFKTSNPPRKEEPIKLPDSLLKKYQDPSRRPHLDLGAPAKPFAGTMISLSGRLSRTHHYWKKVIEKNGGKVSNSVMGVNCLVVSPAERERRGSSKLSEAMERGIPVVREAWLLESMERQEPQPLEAFDVVSDLTVDGKGIPWDKQEVSEESLESLVAELKVYGKRGVHKDTKLQERGGQIFERDGILYNCAFSLCDMGRETNEYCTMQLISVPESNLHLYYKKGRIGDGPRAEERLEEWENVDNAVKEFTRLFEEVTGNEFEPWEREKKIEKKQLKFYPIDMDDGVDVRQGGLGLRQLGVSAAHCNLNPRYALMEMSLDPPDLPMGMLTDVHLKRCEEVLVQFVEAVKSIKGTGQKAEALWSDYSQRWFTLMHSARPLILRDYEELADYVAAAFETVRDINVALRLVEDMSGSTLDDPLSDRYNRLGCSISLLDEDSDNYKMIMKYLEKTYEPIKVGDIDYGVSVENIFAVEPSACPSMDEIKKLPNKVLLWCGTRSSNLLRHLKKGFLPASCSLPVPGHMFGKAIVWSDAAAEAARYGFTAVDRPEGFLVLAVVSQGDHITLVSSPPEDTKSLDAKKIGVKGLGRKKTDESEHFLWEADIKVPCGRLIPSEHKDSPLEYNEYAVYDPKQTRIRFPVGIKYEEKDVVMDTVES